MRKLALRELLPTRATSLLLLAGVIGLSGGLLGAGFRWATDAMQELFLGTGDSVVDAADHLSPWARLVIPAIGGILAGLALHLIMYRRGPFGIADVMELVQTRKGRISVRHSMVQITSSAFTIGSGGSIGREGANSQFAATVADTLCQRFKISSRDRAVLLGCGIAAGMASAYKAPIAASLFVMEVILGNFAMDVLAPIVVASVCSTLVTYSFFKNEALYETAVEAAKQISFSDDAGLVFLALLLGALCGFGGVLFRWSLESTKELFGRLPGPQILKMGLGGLIVGAIGAIGFQNVWGNGQQTIFKIATEDNVATHLIFSLLLLKVLATSVTAGSGGLGGVFTPNLLVGAAFGAAFSILLQQLSLTPADQETPLRASFALVGMAGLCAANTHAPISAIVLVFELTQDYELILPLMLCSIMASVVSRAISSDSMYTARLRARGHEVSESLEELAVRTTYVRDLARRDAASVRDTASFDEVLELFQGTRREIVYVTDANGVLTGHINLHDIKSFLNEGTMGTLVIAADLTHPTPHVDGDESLAAIVDRFDQIGELPVCASREDQRLIGRITRRDLVTCWMEEVLGQRKLRARLRRHGSTQSGGNFVELPPGAELRRVHLPSTFAGRAFDSADLHGAFGVVPFMLIRSVEGDEVRLLPQPQTTFERGDDLVAIGTPEAFEALASGIAENA